MANGCTFFGPKDKEGETCCNLHDKAYVAGTGKLKADWELLQCQRRAKHTIQGGVMFVALSTVVGWPLYLKYRLRDKFGWFPKKTDKN